MKLMMASATSKNADFRFSAWLNFEYAHFFSAPAIG
jgi:hypothetical protein